MNRTQLDAFAIHHTLNASTVDRALNLTGNRPKMPEWRAFAANSLTWSGVATLIAGLIFFVAANWQDMGVLGRFALVQAILIGCIGLAWWRAADESPRGKQIFAAALVGATFAAGVLLALFGQTYQTGADVYELFFAWAALTLPFALAAKSDALWIIWVCILNVGLALLCGWGNTNNFGWRLFNRVNMNDALVLMIPFVVNGLGALICILKTGWKEPKFPARGLPSGRVNLQRVLLTFSIVYGTSACLLAMKAHRFMEDKIEHGATEFAVLLVMILSCAALAWHTLKIKRDVYPLALIAACAIVVSTAYIIRLSSRSGDIGIIFLIGFWIIATSTVAGMVLMHYVRAWHTQTPPLQNNVAVSTS